MNNRPAIFLTGNEAVIYRACRESPRNTKQLVYLLWSFNGRKPPAYAEKIIHICICRINKKLREFGLKLSSGKRERKGLPYRLFALEDPTTELHPERFPLLCTSKRVPIGVSL